MIMWDIEALKSQLKSSGLSEKQRFFYAFLAMLMAVILFEAEDYITSYGKTFWDYINTAGHVLILLGGTFMAYRMNQGSAGRDFIDRFLALGVVTTIRFAVYLGVAIMLLGPLMISCVPSEDGTLTSWSNVVPYLIWQAALMARIAQHVRAINKA